MKVCSFRVESRLVAGSEPLLPATSVHYPLLATRCSTIKKKRHFVAVKKQVFNQRKEVRKLARERVGTVKPVVAIEPKQSRKQPKHKKPIDPAAWDLT